MQHIPLSQGQFVIVDDEDFPFLSEFRWAYHSERNGAQGYAVRNLKIGRKQRLSYMQREIMSPPPGHEVIFLNYDRLDCRKANLKVVTKDNARRYHRVRRDSKTGIKGVHYNEQSNTWSSNIHRYDENFHVGTFDSEKEAIEAYELAFRVINAELLDGINPPPRIDRSINTYGAGERSANASDSNQTEKESS